MWPTTPSSPERKATYCASQVGIIVSSNGRLSGCWVIRSSGDIINERLHIVLDDCVDRSTDRPKEAAKVSNLRLHLGNKFNCSDEDAFDFILNYSQILSHCRLCRVEEKGAHINYK